MLTEGELLRFWPKVDVGPTNEECWPWTASGDARGYGCFRRHEHGPLHKAHRVMYEAMHGEIPDGLCVLHTCDNRLCMNPLHLFLGTKAHNSADMVAKGRSARGEAQGSAKLTREQVLEMRALAGEVSQRRLGRGFGVAQSTVCGIVNRRSWAWLEA